MSKNNKDNIYDKYREVLELPDLTEEEIDEMRQYIGLIARTVCEYIWGDAEWRGN